jgi:hypothetical protein
VQLEHDGVLSTRYHRGTFVERFDEAAVRQQHELYGMLNDIASARAASHAECQGMEHLHTPHGNTGARSPRRTPDRPAGGDPRRPNLPPARLLGLGRRTKTFTATYCRFTNTKTPVLIRGDPDAARAACTGRSQLMALAMLAELVRRREFPATAYVGQLALQRAECRGPIRWSGDF